ncbi:acetyl-CoA synthetase-like protein [Aspergillus fijiensis CBS 313.89]|uniref:Acetyl-CoA synthetase-like protein n=1 Tax=Aspergillus fijiensis CBS 313.89 TaxID=1448319 RepID=A0A8G1RTP8_9EURO|nr:acetyl-CoA synthetase-like protein [Aspergillus fijiensis CBS 313.89]RAK76581.1 acetyl-CoA synthetase-like protein [Aspergillus fijiensis CBS 313.89]
MSLPTPPSPLLSDTYDANQKGPTKSLGELFADIARQLPDHEAIVALHGQYAVRWTFAQLHDASCRLATIISNNGLRPGDRVMTFMSNEAEYALLFWATINLGCQFVPMDPRVLDHITDESVQLLERLDPAAIVVSNQTMAIQVDEVVKKTDSCRHRRCGDRRREIIKYSLGECHEATTGDWKVLTAAELEAAGGCSKACPTSRPVNETCLILLTSGTESLPKVCAHTSMTVGAPALTLMEQWKLRAGEDVLCQHLPNFHIFSILLQVSFWLAGATVLIPSAAFDAAKSLDACFWCPQRVHVACVPTMLRALAAVWEGEAAPLAGAERRSPYSIILGGAPITQDSLELGKGLGAQHVVAGYGTTEGVGALMNTMSVSTIVQSGAGIRICGHQSRMPLPRGQVGEVHQGGLPLIAGYLDATSSEANSSFYERNGVTWMATGDQGYMDTEGAVYILGRYKDLIIRGGENISPWRIEQHLTRLPGIAAASVVGVPDTVAGEVPVAVIIRDNNHPEPHMTTQEIQDAVCRNLGRAFSPYLVLSLNDNLGHDRFPTTRTGKVRKAELRGWVEDYLTESSKELQASQGPESGTALEDLTRCLARIAGISTNQIDCDIPIRAYADSIMIMQFFHLVQQKGLGRLTQQDLAHHSTIRKQVNLLQSRKYQTSTGSISPAGNSGNSGWTLSYYDQCLQLPDLEEKVLQKLQPLGFGPRDVESVIPTTDYLQRFARDQSRSNSWSMRAAWLAQDSSLTPNELESILELWIQRHPLLRATCITYDEERELYLVMHPSDRWLRLQISHDDLVVENAQALQDYRMNDPAFDWVNVATGPPFKATILKTREGLAGVIMHFHHAVFDGFYLFSLARDLQELLRSTESRGSSSSMISTVPFPTFARAFHAYRMTPEAQRSVDFHVKRLQGLAATPNSLWPPQKAPGWMKGDWQDWAASCSDSGSNNLFGPREALDGDQGRGTEGITRTLHLPELSSMRRQFGFPASTIAKCACVMMNWRLTGSEEAVFAGVDSGRHWPMALEPSSTSPLSSDVGDALRVDGPTMTFYVNRIGQAPNETVYQLLSRVQSYQEELSAHAHAPLNDIKARLRAAGTSGADDLRVADDVLHRQSFNWLLEQYESSADDKSDRLRLMDNISRTDLGFMWYPSLGPGDVLSLNVTWDDAQLRNHEVLDITTEYMCAAAWIADPANVNRLVSECPFAGDYAITYWVPERIRR